ncbi:MAG: hypothetical protein PVS3B3_14380 [Ktedonobacteraceae bacterium]
MHKNILHSSLIKDGFILMASDMVGPEGPVKGNTLSRLLDCRSAEEIQTLFANLSAGGETGHPLEETFRGSTFGDLTGKFGVNWLFNFNKNQKV